MSQPQDNSASLHGLAIMVTRPAHQAAAFSAMLEQAGAAVAQCPAIRISAPADTAALADLVARLDDFDILMFNSPNAADYGIGFIHRRRRLPARAQIAAIGVKTAQAIERHGYAVHASPPAHFDSEAFLELPLAAGVRGKRVAIFRGQSGRMLLGETLRQRGAEVEFVTTYQRCGPSAVQANHIRAALRQGVDAVTVTSSEMLVNLVDCLDRPTRALLDRTTLISGHERISATARQLGLPAPITAADPTDESMLTAVLQWAAAR